MLFVSEPLMNKAVEAVLICAATAVEARGLKVAWHPNPDEVRKGLYALLTQLSPSPAGMAAVVEEKTTFIESFGPDNGHQFPREGGPKVPIPDALLK